MAEKSFPETVATMSLTVTLMVVASVTLPETMTGEVLVINPWAGSAIVMTGAVVSCGACDDSASVDGQAVADDVTSQTAIDGDASSRSVHFSEHLAAAIERDASVGDIERQPQWIIRVADAAVDVRSIPDRQGNRSNDLKLGASQCCH